MLFLDRPRVLVSLDEGKQGLQSVDVGGLDQVVVEPRRVRPPSILILPPTGQGDEGHLLEPGLLPDSPCHLVTIHPGHSDIQDHDIWSIGGQRLEGFSTAVCDMHIRTDELEEDTHAFGCVAIVVNDQHSARLED